jgi:hypothetical protein
MAQVAKTALQPFGVNTSVRARDFCDPVAELVSSNPCAAKMRMLLVVVAGWLTLSCLVGAPLSEPRLQGVWIIDVAETEAYLREHDVMSDRALERVRPVLGGLTLRYEGTRVCKVDATGGAEDCMDISITAVTATKTVFTSRGANKESVTSTLTWEDDGYWQETSVFPGYREKFVRPQEPPPRSVGSRPSSNDTPM